MLVVSFHFIHCPADTNIKDVIVKHEASSAALLFQCMHQNTKENNFTFQALSKCHFSTVKCHSGQYPYQGYQALK